ncbi:hypothetical protein [Xylanibacter muris]|uniref:hypothetical protein n=1 Tax=Xylanibacter muris TaxID=2736290 RepID=UPI000FFE78BC|nr:hypothetical protein [Xylanibacter muris]RXE71574.1 hypothetical protein ED352_04520 [Muribaculaceae bacterium Isolate-002 (NCI)]
MSKQQCEICGQMKSQQEMSKSYKHRCKECVARLTRIERKAAKQKAEHLAEILEGTGYEVVSPAVVRNERLAVATAAMQGILSNDRLVNLVDRYNGGIENGVVKFALSITDKLLAEIDNKKGGSNAD